LACVHPCERLGENGAEAVENKSLHWVVVQGSKSVRYVETVMPGMKVPVEELVDMHCPVEKVLPSVDDKPREDRQACGKGIQSTSDIHSSEELENGDGPPVNQLRSFQQCVVVSRPKKAEHRSQSQGQSLHWPCMIDNPLMRFRQPPEPEQCLNEMLEYNGPYDRCSRHRIPRSYLCGGVNSVLV
jgi:hypothetical protein